MMYDFNANDIFEMAEQLERNGADFYRKSLAATQDAQARALLENLARMEEEHEKTFAALKSELGKAEKTQTAFDPEGEAGQYLKSLADVRVFFNKTIDMSSLKEILKSAIEAEKDSIVFYLGMKDMVPEKLGKDRIDAIIKEEMDHIRLLGKQLVALKA